MLCVHVHICMHSVLVCVCVHACEERPLHFLKYGKLLDKLRDCQLLKKGHVVWGYV